MRIRSCSLLLPGLLASFLSAAWAEQSPGDLAETAEAIRTGKIDVGTRYDMNENRGRFHLIHSETVGLECEGCHVAKRYAPDYLVIDRENAERTAAGTGKGKKIEVLDHSVCLGCHKTGGVATVWYQTADK
jgi:hypothetical protein